MSKGLDYAFSHPPVSAIKPGGYSFVCRYISSLGINDHNGKNLLAAEKTQLLAAGLSVVLVAEEGASRMLGGKSAGVTDANHADQVAKALGMTGVPIYFACDFDATPADQTAINAYLDGVASVIGKARTGIYGGYYPVKRALDAGKASYAWQTYAWSGGQWDQRAHIRQTLNGAKVAGASVDIDVSQKDDFGQWPRPKAAPVKPPAQSTAQASSGGFSAPKSLAVAGKTLSLAWDAVLLAGEPPASYTIQALEDGKVALSATSPSNSVNLSGLKAGKKYEIRVWANGGKAAPPHASIEVTV